jgi:hypothetical protein
LHIRELVVTSDLALRSAILGAIMTTVRNVLGLALWPIVALAIVVILTVVLLLADDKIPAAATALLTSVSIVLAVGSWAVWNYPPVYFWRKRLASRVGRRVAPAWKLTVDYRSRIQPDNPRVEAKLGAVKGLTFERPTSRTVRATAMSTTATISWSEPLLDEDTIGAPDWMVSVAVGYAPVPYHESVEFLRGRVMPLLEVLETAIDASPDRIYHLTVAYEPGNNPFEGLLIRAAPDETISAYSVMIKPAGAGEELIEISRERLALQAVSRSRFEELVQGLLTLDGRWPVALLRSLR